MTPKETIVEDELFVKDATHPAWEGRPYGPSRATLAELDARFPKDAPHVLMNRAYTYALVSVTDTQVAP